MVPAAGVNRGVTQSTAVGRTQADQTAQAEQAAWLEEKARAEGAAWLEEKARAEEVARARLVEEIAQTQLKSRQEEKARVE